MAETTTASAAEHRRRLSALSDAATLARRHLLPRADAQAATTTELADAVESAAAVAESAEARLRHGADHTVVALAGTTGSGKSSLLNAIAGSEIARPGLTRPTTSVTQAAVWGEEDAGALLDWLGVNRRHTVGADDPALDGLVLLDLPDFDSVEMAHRDEVDRLVAVVDLMVWVTDPQKYADDAWHNGYLRPLSSHGDVMTVVLNQIDLLPPDGVERCVADLSRLLVEDGLADVEVLPVSARRGDGVAQLLGLLGGEVQARQAMLARVDADLRRAALDLADACDLRDARGRIVDAPRTAITPALTALVERLVVAVGVDEVANAVAAQHRRAAAARSGWPLLRALQRWRRDPRLAVEPAGRSPVARAEISTAMRQAGETIAADLPAGDPWAQAARAHLRDVVEPMTATLDRHTLHALDTTGTPPRWWTAVGRLQGLLQTVALVAVVWLVALATSSGLLRIDLEILELQVRGVPLPTILLLGAIAAGVVVRLVARTAAARGARRRARAVRAALSKDVAAVVDERVGDPLGLLADDRAAIADLLQTAAG